MLQDFTGSFCLTVPPLVSDYNYIVTLEKSIFQELPYRLALTIFSRGADLNHPVDLILKIDLKEKLRTGPGATMETWNKSWEIASEQKWAGQDGKEAIVMLESRTPIKISQGIIWEEDQGQVGPDHADQELEVLVDFSSGEWNKEAGSIVHVEAKEETGEPGDLGPVEGGEESKALNNVENIISSDNEKVCHLDGVGIIIESEDILSDNESSVVMGDVEEICDLDEDIFYDCEDLEGGQVWPQLPSEEDVNLGFNGEEIAFAGCGWRPRQSVVDLSSLLDCEGGEVEMCLTSDVVDDYLFEAKGAGGDTSEPETEILSDHEEGKGSKENLNPAILARLRTNNNLCMMPVKMKIARCRRGSPF